MTWKVRASPISQISDGVRSSSRSPWKVIRPSSGRSTPAMQANSVDLPEPLGPVSMTLPSVTAQEAPLRP